MWANQFVSTCCLWLFISLQSASNLASPTLSLVLTSCEMASFLVRWIQEFSQALFHQCLKRNMGWFWFVHFEINNNESCWLDLFGFEKFEHGFRMKTWIQVCDYEKDEVDRFCALTSHRTRRVLKTMWFLYKVVQLDFQFSGMTDLLFLIVSSLTWLRHLSVNKWWMKWVKVKSL